MAIKKALDTEVGVDADYIRIDSIVNYGNVSVYEIHIYLNEESRAKGKRPIEVRRISMGPSVFDFAYEQLKLVNKFAGATDILLDEWKVPPEVIEGQDFPLAEEEVVSEPIS